MLSQAPKQQSGTVVLNFGMNNVAKSKSRFVFRRLGDEDAEKVVQVNSEIRQAADYAGLHDLSIAEYQAQIADLHFYFGAFNAIGDLVGFAHGQFNDVSKPYFTQEEIQDKDHFNFSSNKVVEVMLGGDYVYSESIMIVHSERGTELAQSLYSHYIEFIKHLIQSKYHCDDTKPVFLMTEIKLTNPNSIFFALKKTKAKIVGFSTWRQNEHFFVVIRDIDNPRYASIEDGFTQTLADLTDLQAKDSDHLIFNDLELDCVRSLSRHLTMTKN